MVLRDIKPETAQPPSTSMPVLPKFSPLNQHPVYHVLPPNTTQTIFLERPFERLSPTLATSPCVVDASSTRRASVHPHVSETMQQGLVHSADFFDDSSSESEWEDRQSSIAQSSTASSDSGLRDLPYDISSDDRSAPRGRSRHRSTIASLLTSPLTHSSGLGTDYSGASDEQASGIIDGRGTSKARQMSLRRLNRDNVRLVDNRSVRSSIDSPRLSIQSNNFSPTSPMAILANPTPFSVLGPLEDTLTALPQSPTFRNHRRNTSNSTSDSVLADSIINAHVMTMCALEALSLDPRTSGDMSNVPGRTYLHSASTTSWPKSTSFSANRRVTLSPLSTGSVDSHNHRTAQIHSPAIQTPNPFPSTSTNTDLPKPTYKPRHHGSSILHPLFSLRDFSHLSNRNTEEYARLDSACTTQFLFPKGLKTPHDDRKGKYVLGLVPNSTEGFEFRSRLERNKSAQGLVRSCAVEGEGSMVVWVRGKKVDVGDGERRV